MISDIKLKIEQLQNISAGNKDKMYAGLLSGFKEIKEDILLIFYSIIITIILSFLKDIPNPFGWDVEKIPDITYLTLFIISLYAMWDIIKTLFNLSEIHFELFKHDPTKKSKVGDDKKDEQEI